MRCVKRGIHPVLNYDAKVYDEKPLTFNAPRASGCAGCRDTSTWRGAISSRCCGRASRSGASSNSMRRFTRSVYNVLFFLVTVAALDR